MVVAFFLCIRSPAAGLTFFRKKSAKNRAILKAAALAAPIVELRIAGPLGGFRDIIRFC